MSENLQFCQQCGQPLSPGARFCEGCGLPVATGPAPGAPPAGPAPAAHPPTPAGAPPVRGNYPWIIGGLGFLAILGILGGYYWGKSSMQVSPPLQVQQTPPSPPGPRVPLEPGPESIPPGPTTSAPGAFDPAAQNLSWPWTSRRLITPADLEGLSLRELELMRNEIYARRGWVFQRDDLRAFFESQPWYRAQGNLDNREDANRYVEREITPLERRNIRIILEQEKKLRR